MLTRTYGMIVFFKRAESAATCETIRATAIMAAVAAADSDRRAWVAAAVLAGHGLLQLFSPGMGCRRHADRCPVSAAAAVVLIFSFSRKRTRTRRPFEL